MSDIEKLFIKIANSWLREIRDRIPHGGPSASIAMSAAVKEAFVLGKTQQENRIRKLREALLDIAQTGESDNPYAAPVDRTEQCIDTSNYALKEDEILNDRLEKLKD